MKRVNKGTILDEGERFISIYKYMGKTFVTTNYKLFFVDHETGYTRLHVVYSSHLLPEFNNSRAILGSAIYKDKIVLSTLGGVYLLTFAEGTNGFPEMLSISNIYKD